MSSKTKIRSRLTSIGGRSCRPFFYLLFLEKRTCWDRIDSSNYAGTISWTEGGEQCQNWDSNYPHSHTNKKDRLFPHDGSVKNAKNYCRDPDKAGKPWCYTTDPNVRWQFCDVPICKYREGKIWRYTTDPYVRWQFCDAPTCKYKEGKTWHCTTDPIVRLQFCDVPTCKFREGTNLFFPNSLPSLSMYFNAELIDLNLQK